MEKFIPYPDKCKPNCYYTSPSECARCEVELEIQARMTEDAQKQYFISQILKLIERHNLNKDMVMKMVNRITTLKSIDSVEIYNSISSNLSFQNPDRKEIMENRREDLRRICEEVRYEFKEAKK
jgi:hypothetical protein